MARDNWWTADDQKRFEARTGCVRDQFEGYFIEPGIHHNGKLVLGESIGDLAGAKIAWLAFQKAQQELEILQAQNKSAVEQAEAQLQFQNTDLALAQVQYSKNARLAEEKLVPQTKADADSAAVKAKEAEIMEV